MSQKRLIWLVVLAVVWLGSGLFSEVEAKRSRCTAKRRACLQRCVRQVTRSSKRCVKNTLLKRKACLKSSYQAGKKCVRKLKCPEATACYKSCRDKEDPVACYDKQGCAKMQSACYGSCQAPLGAMLKTCMEETNMKLEWCKQQKKGQMEGCRANCPKCD